MLGDQPLESVQERDIDVLVLEEIHTDAAFRSWLLGKLEIEAEPQEGFIGAWHSVIDGQWGESDLVVGVQADQGGLVLVMIENKIGAPFQEEQDVRYHRRGEHAVDEGPWDEYKTCLCAPEAYVQRCFDETEFDASITYEELLSWFQDLEGSPRAEFKAMMLESAISQERRGYTPNPDERVTRFWHAYWEVAKKRFPQVDLDRPGPKPAGSDWINFNVPRNPANLRLRHKLEEGYVDLEIPGMADDVERFSESIGPSLPPDADLVKATKSLAVRINVAPLDRFEPVENQLKGVQEGLQAVKRHLQWVEEHQVTLGELSG